MGMAASQARLLSITARIHDVEYQAQSIQHAKIQLATQSDDAYSEYVKALDATTLTIEAINTKNGTTSTIAACFNNLCSKNRVVSSDNNIYALKNRNEQLIVEDDVYEGYQDFINTGFAQTGYQFALYMMDIANTKEADRFREAEWNAYNNHKDEEGNKTLQDLYNNIINIMGIDPAEVDDRTIYDENHVIQMNDSKILEEYRDAKNAYLKELYKKYGNEIFIEANNYEVEENDFDQNLFNYYISIFNQIQNARGCISISEYNGPNGDASRDSEWLHNMVKCGEISIVSVETDSKTGNVSLEGASPSSDLSINYTQTSSIDKAALAKAEAKYEKDLKTIEKKDKEFDLSLSKLESERTALKTQLESLNKVIEDNIERSFGIFS